MDMPICGRCGYTDTALVKKELVAGKGFRKLYRCPRCSNVWEMLERE